jgi:hypothetical protein
MSTIGRFGFPFSKLGESLYLAVYSAVGAGKVPPADLYDGRGAAG